ncbi:hypothetical protein [uncultured Tenacibaculum sp.]|nr:hypothetical protein [uncultured Tenacibaculum sp.]
MITVLLFRLFKILFDKKDFPHPKNFKPFLKWNYDISFWNIFKKKEFKHLKKRAIKEALFPWYFLLLIIGITYLIGWNKINNIQLTLQFTMYSLWIVFMISSATLIHFYSQNKRLFPFKYCKLAFNSSGFMVNNVFLPIEVHHAQYDISSFEITEKYDALCFHHFTSKITEYDSFEYGSGKYITIKEYYIPIPCDKKEDVDKFIDVFENRYKKKIKGRGLIKSSL